MSFLRSALIALAMPLVLAFSTGGASAQRPEIFQSGRAQLGQDLAVGGHDTVAYHTQRMPVPGSEQFAARWKEAVWRFASKENLDLFVAEPEKYAPQYGGYCAFAVAHGGTSPGDPKVWSVIGGKLYLNLNPSIQSQWNRDQTGFITRADQNWPRVVGR